MMERFPKTRVWATWRGKGWVPCLWGNRRGYAAANCDPDERVILVEVRQVQRKKAKRG